METGYMHPTKGYVSSKSPSKSYASIKSPSKGYASSKPQSKDCASTKSPSKGYVSRSPEHHSHSATAPSTPRTRRPPGPASSRDPFGNASHSSSSNSGSCKGSDCSPTKGRHQKYTSCTDNHGIRPPPPEQYLTPLQQKEVDTEIDELRGQLSRMQEDWIEEECHRVEAQLALKEAWREIQQFKNAVDAVRNALSDAGGVNGDEEVQKYFQDINAQNHKLEKLLLNMELAQANLFPHCASQFSPQPCPHHAPLFTYEKLCTEDRQAPFHCALCGVSSVSHPCLVPPPSLPAPLREMGIQTESCPAPTTTGYPSDLDTIAEQRTFRSQACSPTSTWMSDEGGLRHYPAGGGDLGGTQI
ncbi:hypothetical protein CRUP_004476 [Coryphaenoides rupestris]|nr:hypothetical protein CRUP_004476 [Coryphaenoides rupestris]